jgi:hypothetical protein
MFAFLFDYALRRIAKRQVENLLSECLSMKQEIDELKVKLRQQQADIYVRYAGTNLDVMLASRERAEQFMSHEDPRIRFVALDLILSLWGLTEAVVAKCKPLALEDCDAEVRQVALLCIGKYYHDTRETNVCKLLAKISADEATNMDVREVAYDQLCRVTGIPCHPRKFIGVTFPENIDWALLGKYGDS